MRGGGQSEEKGALGVSAPAGSAGLPRGWKARDLEQQPRNWCFPLRVRGPGLFPAGSQCGWWTEGKALGEPTPASSGLDCL